MSQIASTWQAEWVTRPTQSLAGQYATVVQRDGTHKPIRFGPDVQLRPEGGQHVGTAPILRPIVEGHLDTAEATFDPEDRDLILSDGSTFRISFSHRSFFFAIAPLSARVRCVQPA
jgi:hypothetical protein